MTFVQVLAVVITVPLLAVGLRFVLWLAWHPRHRL